MTTCKRVFALGGCMLLGAASVVQADATQGSDMQAELSALRSRIAQLEGQQNQSWLNERRAEEVKTLVREVLADADTRASMQEGGITAGYNNGFFIGSEDGRFLLKVGGQVQVRYTANFREGSVSNAPNDDKWNHGFSMPRTKLFFDGHIGSPKIQYNLVLATYQYESSSLFGTGGNAVFVEEAYVTGQVADNVSVFGGLTKIPFSREGGMDSRYLMTMDRPFFVAPYRQIGAGVKADITDSVRVAGMFYNDYTNGPTSTFPTDWDGIEYGLSGRAEVKLSGNWDQLNDYSAWSGEETLAVIGFGALYEQGREGTIATHGDESRLFNATADFSLESNGLSVLVAGRYNTNFDNSNYGHGYGFLGQVGYFVIPDKFEPYARAEYFNNKQGNGEAFYAALGANYYLARHNAKFTFELNYSKYEAGFFSGAQNGFIQDPAGNRNQITVAGQFQLLF